MKQKYQQKTSSRYATYDEARKAFDKLPRNVRKRIRRRRQVKAFDVTVYERLPEPETHNEVQEKIEVD